MPEPDLIDRYLTDLRQDIRRRPDADNVVAEVEDHLRETAAGLVATGLSEIEAQRTALARFGDPSLMRDIFASAPSGGVVMPTGFTRIAGVCALLAAAAWTATAILVWWTSGLFEPFSSARYLTVYLAVTPALILSGVALAGFLCRIGRPDATALAAVLFGLGAAGLMLAPWAWVLCGLFVGGAFLAAVVQCRQVLGHVAWPLWGTALAWPIGMLAAALLSGAALGLGPVDEYGDHPAAAAVSFTITVVILVVGLVALGGWLSREPTRATRDYAIA